MVPGIVAAGIVSVGGSAHVNGMLNCPLPPCTSGNVFGATDGLPEDVGGAGVGGCRTIDVGARRAAIAASARLRE